MGDPIVTLKPSRKKKEEPTDAVKEFFKIYHTGKLSIDEFKQHHDDAVSSAETVIADEKGRPDYSRFDNGHGDLTAKDVQDLYRTKIRDTLFDKTGIKLKEGLSKGDTELQKNNAVESWYGLDVKQLEMQMNQYGSKFDRDLYQSQFKRRAEMEHKKKVGQNATMNLKEEDIDQVVKATGLEGRLDKGLSLEEAKSVISLYAENDWSPNETELRGLVGHKLKKSAYDVTKGKYVGPAASNDDKE